MSKTLQCVHRAGRTLDARYIVLLALGIFAVVGRVEIRAANRGDEVVIIYNTRTPESRAVADYYAAKRQVPTNQIFGFALSTNEEMNRAEFRSELQKPLARKLEDTGLWHMASGLVADGTNGAKHLVWRVVRSKIRYAALCYGVPLRILQDANIKIEGGEKLRPEQREIQRNSAAVDSELAWLPLVEQTVPLGGPLRNWCYGATNVELLHPTNGLLMVTRLDGPTADIARGLVDKALQAEADGLWGRAYFDLRNITNAGFKLGDDWIRGASEVSRRLGFETVVDDNPGVFPAGFPMSQIAIYMGWYSEHVTGPLAQPVVEFMPGAVAYHLHSFSANTLRSTNRFWAGPLLARGATATMGCVDEPYLTFTPDVAAFTARFLFMGFSFGEAAYAGQDALSWQTTVVGDPLYRPFGRTAEDLHKDLERRGSKLLAWSYLRLANLNLATGRAAADVVKMIEALEITKGSAVLQEKLGDLYAGLGKPASSLHAFEQALKLDASPLQRVRLLTELGEKQVTSGNDAAAYAAFQTLLQDFPAYPDRLSILQEIGPLAQKLHKKNEAEKFEAELKKLTAAAK
jgi:uncharacterized protein (TIGR03790 family)